MIGIAVTGLFAEEAAEKNGLDHCAPKVVGSAKAWDPVPPSEPPKNDPNRLSLISKPRPTYTEEARTENIQGTVILRIQFLSNGTIGSIQTVKGLPNGLTEQAIAAARKIRFEPQKKDGVPITVTKHVEYTFTIY